MDEYDSLVEYVSDAMADGYVIEAEDFEGRQCAYCGDMTPFVDFPDGVETWDVTVQEPNLDEPEPYVHRHYFCSEICKSDAKRDILWNTEPQWHEEPEVIHVNELEGKV